jgi:PQQ-dependent catabolism-associated CXXCW motif protein
MRFRTFVGATLCALLWLFPLIGQTSDVPLFSAEGYRIARYRAPLPQEPPAGRRLTTDQLIELISREKPLLIDVQAVTLRPETEEFGIAWLPSRQRWHIPGSTWLPNVGYGRLEPRMHDYLKNNLERLTRGDRDRPLVFYCVVDCWMSWNAVKRAHALGYGNLYWYPQGSDGWGDAGLELVPGVPVPIETYTIMRLPLLKPKN